MQKKNKKRRELMWSFVHSTNKNNRAFLRANINVNNETKTKCVRKWFGSPK